MTDTDIVERLRMQGMDTDMQDTAREAANEIEKLRAVIVRAKDALLDGQSAQWVHDLLVDALHD